MINLQHEELRLSAMRRYLNFGFEKEKNLKDIVMLTSQLLESPVSLITLIDRDIQYIISNHGIEIDQMPRETSFCTHAIMQDDIMVVEDARKDSRFAQAPLVVYNPHVRFYTGMSLKSKDGLNVGTLCVFDNKPKVPSNVQLDCLKALTNQVANIMELNMSLEMLNKSVTAIEEQNKALRKIAYVQSHEVRAPLCNALGIMDMIKTEDYRTSKEDLDMMDFALRTLDEKIHSIVSSTTVIN